MKYFLLIGHTALYRDKFSKQTDSIKFPPEQIGLFFLLIVRVRCRTGLKPLLKEENRLSLPARQVTCRSHKIIPKYCFRQEPFIGGTLQNIFPAVQIVHQIGIPCDAEEFLEKTIL